MKNLMTKIADGIEIVLNEVKYVVSAGLITGSVYNLSERNYSMAAIGGGLGVYILVQELIDEHYQKEIQKPLSGIEKNCSKIKDICDKW